LVTYGSNSALYWLFYYWYSEKAEELIPKSENVKTSYREAVRISIAGLAASLTACMCTNPLDVVRTRLQLQLKSEGQGEIGQVTKVVKNLVKNEGFLRGFSRGLYARMLQSSCTSVFIILGYEYVKKLSLKEEQIEKFEIWLLGNLAPDFEGTIFLAFVFLGAVEKLNNVWRWTCWLRECRKQYFLHMNGGTYIL